MHSCVSSLGLYGAHGSYIVRTRTRTCKNLKKHDANPELSLDILCEDKQKHMLRPDLPAPLLKLDESNELTRISCNMSPKVKKASVWLGTRYRKKQEDFKQSKASIFLISSRRGNSEAAGLSTSQRLFYVMTYYLCNRKPPSTFQ